MQVDILGTAKNAQWDASTFLDPGALKAISPAKVNLFLDVGKPDADGYHEVNTVMHALALHDTIFMSRRSLEKGEAKKTHSEMTESPEDEALEHSFALGGPADNILVSIDVYDKTNTFAAGDAKNNLIFQAIDALAKKIGYNEDELIKVRVEKEIPAQAGLGGGSSNAATTLLLAARFWGVAEGGKTLEEAARSLGADVAFFLKGGCAYLTGRGDVFERSLEPMKLPIVVIKPDIGVSTPEAYRAFDADPYVVQASEVALVEDVSSAVDVPLCNDLQSAVWGLEPKLEDDYRWLSSQEGVLYSNGDPCALLCGSGAAMFAIPSDQSDAMRIVAAAKARGLWARASSFSSLSACVVGNA